MNKLTKKVRSLRQNSTQAEQLLWQKIRSRQLKYKFYRQHPVKTISPILRARN